MMIISNDIKLKIEAQVEKTKKDIEVISKDIAEFKGTGFSQKLEVMKMYKKVLQNELRDIKKAYGIY